MHEIRCSILLFLSLFIPSMSYLTFLSHLPYYLQSKSSPVPLRNPKLSQHQSYLTNILRNPETGIGIGIVGIVAVLFNRLSIPLDQVPDIQSRADIIAVLACSGILLNAVSEQDITIRERDAVALVGYTLKSPWIDSSLKDNSRITQVLDWTMTSILRSTPTVSVHILQNNKFIGRAGVIGFDDQKSMSQSTEDIIDITRMPILADCLASKKELYLPDIQILPGKIEFSYLPVNIQAIAIFPFLQINGAVIVSANKAKSLKVNDILKIRSTLALLEKSFSS